MTRKLFDWIGLGRRQPGRSAGRATKPRQSRLAFEAIEPRLLLSVASGDVSEGGMVSFGATLTLDGECDLHVAGGDIAITDDLGAFTFNAGSRSDSLPNSMESQGQPSAPRAEKVVPTSPKNIGLDDEDFSPKAPEIGTVDLTSVAYDRVFAEIGETAETPGLETAIATRMESASTSLTHEPSTSPQIEHGKDRSARRFLTGSRGRLAAFDLAIQDLSATDWHRDVSDPNMRDAATEMLSSETEPSPAPSPRPAMEAFSESNTESGTPTRLVAGATPTMTRVAFQQQPTSPHSALDEVGPKERLPADEPVGHPTSSTRPDEGHRSPTRGLAVQLDPPREKNPVHLVLLAGISQAVLRRNKQRTADSGYEQLPPRKR